MKFNTKKIVLLLLTIAMVFSLASVLVFADEEIEEHPVMLMATEPDATYTVVSGLTRSFENLGTIDLTVKTNNKYMDYVVYYKDGSIKQYYRNTYSQNIVVPAGGKLVVTARKDNVDCTLADDYFIVEDQDNPVFNTKNISDRFTYSFTNISLIPIKLLSTTHRCDYIVYAADGTVSEQQRDTYFDIKEIPAGYTIKITSRNNDLEVCPLYEYFSVEQCSEKVFKKAFISNGETYSFTNTSDSPYNLLSNATNRDYIIYDGSDAVTSYDRSTWWNEIEIPSGSTIKITARNSGLEICGINEFFTIKKENTQVFKKVVIPTGETYSFTNTSDSPYDLLSNTTDRDYIIYDGNGNVTSYERSTWWPHIELPANSTIKITARNSGLEICGINEFFIVKKENTQVFKKVVIPTGETYSFTNTSDSPYNLLSNTTNRDYIIYDGNGNVTSYERSTWWPHIELPANSTIKITARNSGLEICGINEFFTVKKENTPVFKKVIIPAGETYSFTNTSDNPYNLLSNTTNRDYIIHDGSDAVTSYDRSTWWNEIEIPSGSTIKITARYSGLEICGIYKFFDVVENTESVFKTIEIPKGEKYIFKNISGDSFKVLASGTSCDYVVYNSNGTAASSKVNTNINGLAIPAGYSVAVFAKNGPTTCGVLNEAFTAKHEDLTGLFTKFEKGKIYEITNLDAADYEFSGESDNCIFDYIVYGEEDTIITYEPSVVDKTIIIPSGGRAILTTKSDFLIKIDDKISVSEYDTPVYKSIEINKGETYYFDNTTLLELSLRLSEGYYDYIIYNKNGTVNTYSTNQHISSLTVPSESKVAVTSRDLKKTAFALYDIFDIESASGKDFIRKELQSGQSIKFKNTTLKDYKVHFHHGYYDYALYNADGSVKQYGYNQTESAFTIASNGYIVITARQPVVVECLKETFEASDVDVPVFNYNYIYSGETLVVKNVALKDYTMFIAANHYDYVMYDGLDKISSSGIEKTDSSIKFASGTSAAITPLNGSCTIVTLNDIFSVTHRSYPAMMRKTLYENEKYSFVNTYDEKCTLYNSNKKLSYVIYTETESPLDAKEEVYKSTMEIPAGGRTDVTIKSSNVMFAGPYEAFSGEDLTVKATGVTLSTNSLNIVKGKQALLKATVMPEDATNKTVSWSSSDTSIVTVAQTGKVTAKAVGTAIITVTTEDGSYTANCEVTVTDGTSATVSVTGVALNKTTTSMTVGGTQTLTATVSPTNATNKNVTWTSSNTSVATVSNGVITAKAAGTAKITVTTTDGSKTATCVVTVTANASSVTIGDANGDGDVDFTDAIVVLKHDAGVSTLSGDKLKAADTNGDGDVDFVDAIQILKYDSGLISSFN